MVGGGQRDDNGDRHDHAAIGINVFVLNGMAKNLNLKTIYAGILPFFATDILRLAIVLIFPTTALWLPKAWGLM